MPTRKLAHDWFEFYRKFVDKAVHDVDSAHQAVNLKMATKLAKGSPKQAQMTIQVLWGEYKKLKTKGDPLYLGLRLHCCGLATGYVKAFGATEESTLMIMRMCPGLDEELIAFGREQGWLE